MIKSRLENLRNLMKQQGIDGYIIPSEDFHQSEYVGDYFKARAYISGFTGSAGTVLVMADKTCLWTDGRYFLQAEEQLQGSGITLQKMGNPGVPSLEEYLEQHFPQGGTLGFDGRVISVLDGNEYQKIVAKKQGTIEYNVDLIDKIWEDRPGLSKEKAFFLEEKYSGESTASKLSRIRQAMADKKANIHIISALDDICWTFNIRGNDVKYSPLVLSYGIITMDEVLLFVDKDKLTQEIQESFEGLGMEIKPYNGIYDYVQTIGKENRILLDPNKMNYALYGNINPEVSRIEERNPSILMKAIKNEVEVDNFIKAHIKDGIAWTKFMCWIKNNIRSMPIDEIAASDKLEDFRKEQEGYLRPSFAPISGYGEHGAIVHYEATQQSKSTLQPKGLYLSDTGGNYYEGSTDITRTLALGELTEEERFHFTLVLKSHIGLASAKFLYGTSGYALDILCKKPFWDLGLDYNHGTGHGIGYLLNIHEAPSGFRYKINPLRDESHPFQKGMIVTIEPGIYMAGSHGIRTENCVIIREGEVNTYGQFMYFEPCTMVPIDLDALDPGMITQEEKDYLNDYHQKVFNIISPYLNTDEVEWLKKYTRKI